MKETVRRVGKQIWHVDEEFVDLLFPSEGRGLTAGLADAAFEPVKRGHARRTLRAQVGGQALYVKEYAGSWRGGARVRREWKTAGWAFERGLPTPRPVAACWDGGAWFVTLDTGGRNLSDLVLGSYFEPNPDEPAYPGHRPPELVRLYRMRRSLGDLPPDVPRPRELARLMADLLLALHRLGLRHRDLHPGNLLLVRGGKSLRLEVLDLPALEIMPGLQSLMDHLVQLNHHFEPLATRAERFRLLDALAGTGIDFRADAPRRIEQGTRRYRREFYLGRDRRCLRDGKYFRRVHTGSLTCEEAPGSQARYEIKGFLVADLADRLASDPDVLLGGLQVREPVKQSRRETAGFGVLGGQRVFIKRDQPRPFPACLGRFVRGTRQRRAWIRANALLTRGIPTARPLAWLDLHVGLFAREGVFVTEALDGWQSVDRELVDVQPGLRPALVEAVAREVRRLHDAGLSNRDLKAQNILVKFDGSRWRVAFIDMAGLRRHRYFVSRRRRVRDLMRLAFSWSGVGISGQARGLNVPDRLRFLKTYLGFHVRQTMTERPGGARSDTGRPDWGLLNRQRLRRWWRDVERELARKVRRART